MTAPIDTAPEREAVTPTGLLARVRASREAAVAAEVDLLLAAAEWADAHPVLDDDPEPYPARGVAALDPFVEEAREFDEDRGIPAWQWASGAPFAAALGRSTAAGDSLIRDALILRHRLPRVWTRVAEGTLEAVAGQADRAAGHRLTRRRVRPPRPDLV